MVKKKQLDDKWYVTHWRPMAAFVYLAICIFDFIIAPIIFSIHSSILHNNLIQIWQPLTLQSRWTISCCFWCDSRCECLFAWTRKYL